MPENNSEKPSSLLKVVSPDSALGLYLISKKPRYLWSFIFSLATVILMVLFAFSLADAIDSNAELAKKVMSYIIVGSCTMGLSRLFYGDIKAFLSLMVAFVATVFIYQWA